MSDRHDIIDVLVRYATGIDSKRWALFRTCFTDDVHADYGVDVVVCDGADALTTWMEATHRDMPATNHMMTNFVVEVDGDHATATTYVHVVLVLDAARSRSVDAVGTYHDRLVRTAEGWRISDRRFVLTRSVLS